MFSALIWNIKEHKHHCDRFQNEVQKASSEFARDKKSTFLKNYNCYYFKKLAHKHYYSTTSQPTCRHRLSGGRGPISCVLCAEKYATFTLWHIRHTQISFRCRMAPVMTLIKPSKVSTHGHFLARTSSYTFLPSLARSLHKQEKERSREGQQQTERQTAAQKRECWQIKRVSRWRYLRFVINKFRNRQKDALLVDK